MVAVEESPSTGTGTRFLLNLRIGNIGGIGVCVVCVSKVCDGFVAAIQAVAVVMDVEVGVLVPTVDNGWVRKRRIPRGELEGMVESMLQRDFTFAGGMKARRGVGGRGSGRVWAWREDDVVVLGVVSSVDEGGKFRMVGLCSSGRRGRRCSRAGVGILGMR